MFQWLLLVVAAGGVASLARGRGGSPILFGAATVVAFVAGALFGPIFGSTVIELVLPWMLVATVAVIARFMLGAGRPKPDGMWSCPECKMVNEASYIVCEACQRPWSAEA
jgi:hypothetical protein